MTRCPPRLTCRAARCALLSGGWLTTIGIGHNAGGNESIDGGMPDYVVTSWNGVGAPAGVPAEIINARRDQTDLGVARLTDRMLRLGLEARGSPPKEMRNRMAADATKWREVID